MVGGLEFTGERVVEGKTPERIWRDHLARYQFAARMLRDQRVLDVSCGTGYGSKILLDGGAREVVGGDISADSIAYALEAYSDRGLVFKELDLLELPFSDEEFEAVVSFETIEHVPDQERALSELHRVLAPNGLLVISSPNRTVTSPGRGRYDPPSNQHHVMEYTQAEFIGTLSRRFEILGVYGQRGVAAFLYLRVVRGILRRLRQSIYRPDAGAPELEPAKSCKQYRYVTAVLRKR